MTIPIFQKAGRLFIKNLPTVMSGLAVCGVMSTGASAARDTKKALCLIDDEVNGRYPGSDYNALHCTPALTKKETFKLTWKCYIPTIIIGGITIALVGSSNSINLKRNAALASVYTMTERALKTYQDKVVETLGENKAARIKEEIYSDTIKAHEVKNHEIVYTGKGNTLCYEVTSGRYFRSDIESIRKVQNELNEALLIDSFVTLNELYDRLGLEETKLGYDLGWDVEDGLMSIDFCSQLTSNGEPCLVVDTTPKYNFRHC